MPDIHIPYDLLHDILCRVPAESLLLCRGVCKSWRQIIDDVDFINSHTTYQSSSTARGELLVEYAKCGRCQYGSISLDFLNFSNCSYHTAVLKSIKNLSHIGVPHFSKQLPPTYCNGLFLLDHYKPKRTWVLWNPLTQDLYELPPCDVVSDHIQGFGLGYDPITNDYKVVIIDEQRSTYKTSIFSLKSKLWKSIKDCPFTVRYSRNGAYCNGNLYWKSSNQDFIIGLDLNTENYRKLFLPTSYQGECINMDVSGGCLILSNYYYIYKDSSIRWCFNGWMMKHDDGGNTISWTRIFSLPNSDPLCAFRFLRPLMYSKSNRDVLFECGKKLCWLDIDNNCAKKIQIDGLYVITFQVWIPSLIRLENNVAADRTRQLMRKIKTNKRSEIDITITEVVR